MKWLFNKFNINNIIMHYGSIENLEKINIYQSSHWPLTERERERKKNNRKEKRIRKPNRFDFSIACICCCYCHGFFLLLLENNHIYKILFVFFYKYDTFKKNLFQNLCQIMHSSSSFFLNVKKDYFDWPIDILSSHIFIWILKNQKKNSAKHHMEKECAKLKKKKYEKIAGKCFNLYNGGKIKWIIFWIQQKKREREKKEKEDISCNMFVFVCQISNVRSFHQFMVNKKNIITFSIF